MNQAWMQILLVTAGLFAAECSAHGAIISHDFRTPGDGLLTYDSVNHREWLDLTETIGSQINTVQQSLLPDGALSEFNIATVDDVRAFVSSGGYAGTAHTGEPYISIANQLIDTVGETFNLTTELNFGSGKPVVTYSRMSDALVLSYIGSQATVPFTVFAGSSPIVPGQIVLGDTSPSYADTDFHNYPIGLDPSQYRGVWLYRQAAIPEPSAIALLSIALMATPLRLRAFA